MASSSSYHGGANLHQSHSGANADSESVERLLADVSAATLDAIQASRSNSNDVLEARIDMVKTQLAYTAQRNIGLTQRARMLERALYKERTKYSNLLLGTGPPPAKVPEAEQTLAYFEARIPKVRKNRARPHLCQLLKEVGINNPDAVFGQRSASGSTPLERLPQDEQKVGASRIDDEHVSEDAIFWPRGVNGLVPGENGSCFARAASPDDQETLSTSWGNDEQGWAESERHGVGVAPETETEGNSWCKRATLRSHMDGVRCVACAGSNFLLSGGEDTLVKIWDLSFLKNDHRWCGRGDLLADDLEPFATFRDHAAAVLALAFNPKEGLLFSGGLEPAIRVWRMPTQDYDAYGPSDPSGTNVRHLTGHTDAIWSLQLHPALSLLASASADGTVRLWQSNALLDSGKEIDKESSSAVLSVPGTRPVSVAWTPDANAHLLVGFTSGKCCVYDVEQASWLTWKESVKEPGAVTSVACSATGDGLTNIAVSGHAKDNCARVFCSTTGKHLGILRGHDDAVTSVSMDPKGGYNVLTGSHDGALRIFDLRTMQCLESIPLHSSKYDEAVHCACHCGDFAATAGADGAIHILTPPLN